MRYEKIEFLSQDYVHEFFLKSITEFHVFYRKLFFTFKHTY